MSATPATARAWALVAVAVALGVQALVLYLPTPPGPPSPMPYADKLIHAGVFALPVLLAGWLHRPWVPAVVGAVLVHAPVSEIIQHALLPSRSGDALDAVADLVGIGAAILWVEWIVRRPRRRR